MMMEKRLHAAGVVRAIASIATNVHKPLRFGLAIATTSEHTPGAPGTG